MTVKNNWNDIWKKNKFTHISLPTLCTEAFEKYHISKEIKKNKKNIKILDAGCGNGRNFIYLNNLGYNVYGVDNSEFIIKKLKKQFPKYKKKFENSYLSKLNFPDNYFDAILSDASLYYSNIEEFNKGIIELRRTLKKNGIIRVYTKSNRHAYLKKDRTVEMKIKTSWEKNLTVTLLSQKDIKKFFKGFKNIKIGLDEFNFINKKKLHSYWVITAKKAY